MLLILAAFMVSISAAPPPNIISYPTDNVQILRYENDIIDGSNYRFAFEQSDGTKHEQEGTLQKGEGQEEDFLVMRGFYSWVGPDGVTYSVTYVASKNGFEPKIEQGPGGVVPDNVATLIG